MSRDTSGTIPNYYSRVNEIWPISALFIFTSC